MVHRCCISSCKMNVRVAEAKGLSYHCFPLKDPHRAKWIQAILPYVDKPENFKIVQGYTRVCSRHFRLKEYSLDSKKRARLNSNAVPSVFPRKNTPVHVSSPIEATKSQVVTVQNAAKASRASSCLSSPKEGRRELNSQDDPAGQPLTINDQSVLSLLSSSLVEKSECVPGTCTADDANSDVSNADKQEQTKRKRRKWNRTTSARTSKIKQKKALSAPNVLSDNTFDDDTLDDLNLCTILGLTRNSSLDLESGLDIHSRVAGLGLSASDNEIQSLSLQDNDPLRLEDLNLMSVEERELLESIQAVSLDCGEADMNLNLKNIHIGSNLLTPEPINSHLLDSSQKSLNNPILLEDALISSASEMSLQPSNNKFRRKSYAKERSVGAPSASEIDKLACDFSSSLLTSLNLPDAIGLTLDDALRLPVSEFSSQNPINLELVDNLLANSDLLDNDIKSGGDNAKKRDYCNWRKGNKTGNQTGEKTVPRKKLVGIVKKPKNNDKYFGKFSVERFCDSDKDIEYYTSFPTYSHFEAFFNSLEHHVEKLKVTDIMHGVADLKRSQQEIQGSSSCLQFNEDGTCRDNNNEEQKRRPITGRSMTRIDELFMTLIRLKRRLPEKVLGHMFYVSQPTVSRTIRAWTMLLSTMLEPIPSASESFVPPENLKNRQTSAKTNSEQNYFTSKGIYVPDSFRQLFLSDVATSIIASAHSSRSTCNSVTSSAEVAQSNNKGLSSSIPRLSISDNSNSTAVQVPTTSSTATSSSTTSSSPASSSPSKNCSNCDYCSSSNSLNIDAGAFADVVAISGSYGEVEIESSDAFQWSLQATE